MQQLQLSIPEPCHQSWHEMTPTQQGRFCNACAKEVVDFSIMSDSEVLNYFSSLKNEKICGRAYPDQLERAITKPKIIKKAKFWYWNYAAILFLFFSKMSIKAQAQGQVISVPAKIDINSSLQGSVGGIMINNKKTVTGKITNTDGTPVSFATIKIKGTNQASGADADGNYCIKVNTKTDMLEISAIGFETKEISLKDFNSTDIVLTQLENKWLGEVVVTVGAVSYTDYDYTPPNPKHIAVLEVKDNGTMQPVSNATVIIKKAGDNKTDKAVTDKKGIYKFRKIGEDDTYSIIINADGYTEYELKINGFDLKLRKISKQIFLTKKIVIKVDESKTQEKDYKIRVGQISSNITNSAPLYVVDGITWKSVPDFDTNNIESVDVLQGAAAAALFGSAASAGAIVITTKKKNSLQSYKNLSEVIVTGNCFGSEKKYSVMGAVSSTGIETIVAKPVKSTVYDSLKLITTNLYGTLKISPNPVQRGNSFTLSLKLKQTGNYNIQIVNAAGQIVLQKQTNNTAKEYIEKIQTNIRWSGGVYFIRVVDNNNKLISANNLILQ